MKYQIINNAPGYGRKRINKNSIASLVGEYEHFLLFRGRHYQFTVSKNDIRAGLYTVEKIGGDAR